MIRLMSVASAFKYTVVSQIAWIWWAQVGTRLSVDVDFVGPMSEIHNFAHRISVEPTCWFHFGPTFAKQFFNFNFVFFQFSSLLNFATSSMKMSNVQYCTDEH